MQKNKSPVAAGISIGALLSIGLSVLLSGGTALLMLDGQTGIEKMHYFTLSIQFVAIFVGAMAAMKLTGKAPALVGGISVAIYLFILLATNILFFQGDISDIWSTLLAVVLGCIFACTLCMAKPRKKKYKKIHNR